MFEPPPDLPPSSSDPLIERLAECGLNRDGLTVEFDEDAQHTVVVFSESSEIEEEQFECIRDALDASFAWPEFQPTELGGAYLVFAEEAERLRALAERPRRLAETRANVDEMGLLEGFPRRSDYADFADYLRALERHAGVSEGTYLFNMGDTVRYQPPVPETGQSSTKDYETSVRVLTVLFYANQLEGFDFGFVGNERAAKP